MGYKKQQHFNDILLYRSLYSISCNYIRSNYKREKKWKSK